MTPLIAADVASARLDGAKRPPTPVGWSDTDWIKHLQEQAEQPHPLAGQHINQGSMDAAADAYEAEYYDALERDAQRYRWLRGDSCPDHSVRWTQWEVRCWRAPQWTADLRRSALDAAIDAATLPVTEPKREPLPDHEIVTMYAECPRSDAEMIDFARSVERAHVIGGSDAE